MNELISVIVPIFNSETYLFQTLTSLKVQTYTNFEALLIDDGSTDSSGHIAEQFSEGDNRFKVIHTNNGGVSRARNIGLTNARGDWIYCLDSDDIMEADMLEMLMRYSEQSDMVVSSVFYERVQQHETQTVQIRQASLRGKAQLAAFLADMSITEKDLFLNYLWNRIMRREIIVANNLWFNESISLGEDFLFLCDYVSYCQSVTLLDKPLYHYYMRGTGLSLAGRFNSMEAQRRKIMRERFRAFLEQFGVFAEAYDLFATIEGRHTFIGMKKMRAAGCHLTKEEKAAYIDSFWSQESIEFLLYYLNQTKGIKPFVWKLLIRRRMTKTIVTFLSHSR